MTLEESVEKLEVIVKEGVPPTMLEDGTKVTLAGKADKLAQTIESMKWNLVFALAIIYLLMSALFGNFIYPLVILFTVPMATAGGFVGLKLTNMFVAPQPLRCTYYVRVYYSYRYCCKQRYFDSPPSL